MVAFKDLEEQVYLQNYLDLPMLFVSKLLENSKQGETIVYEIMQAILI